jgi:sugar phosphate permease
MMAERAEMRTVAKVPRVRWRIVALLMAISFLNYFNRISMPVAGGRIMRERGLSEVQMGWVYSALIIAYTLCMVPGGWLSDRRGGWAALVVMGLGTAACVMLTGVTGMLGGWSAGLVFPALLLVRAGLGGFTAPLYPAAGRIVTYWIPFDDRALANGMVTGVAMVGIGFTYPTFAWLIDALGWPASFLFTGTITAALACWWAWYGANDPRGHPSVSPAELSFIRSDGFSGDTSRAESRGDADNVDAGPAGAFPTDLIRDRNLWLLTASYAAVGYIEYLVFYWSEHYFAEILRFGTRQSRLAAMIPPLAMAAGMPLGGWLSDRLIPGRGYRAARAGVAVGGMVACAALLAAATAASSRLVVVGCFTAALGAIGLCEGSAWATAIGLGGRKSAALSGAIVNTGGNAGGFVSPVVTPFVGAMLTPSLGRETAWAWSLRLGCVICLLGSCLWLWIDAGEGIRRERRGAAAGTAIDGQDP